MVEKSPGVPKENGYLISLAGLKNSGRKPNSAMYCNNTCSDVKPEDSSHGPRLFAKVQRLLAAPLAYLVNLVVYSEHSCSLDTS